MNARQVASFETYFTPPQEGYRSVNLKLDSENLKIVESYLPTHKSIGVLDAIFASFQEGSRQRANTLIAPYGSGKSSLLLFLSVLLEGREQSKPALKAVQDRIRTLSPSLAQIIDTHLTARRGYVVVPLSGDEGPLDTAFRSGLQLTFAQNGLEDEWEKLCSSIKGKARRPVAEEGSIPAVDLYRQAAKRLVGRGYKGIVVAYDEFGKVLEAQQVNPRPADLFFLQTFAELCSRSGADQIHLLLSLHQGFAQYAHRLPLYLRNEWTKIEGRFQTFHFVEDSLQVYELIAQAIKQLQTPEADVLIPHIEQAVAPYVSTVREIPAFAPIESDSDLQRLCQGIYPLDPIALYVLPRLSARVAQNERTLFHFLLGQEAGCLCRVLSDRALAPSLPLIRAADLFDYFSDLMMKDTGVGGTSRRYAEMKAALERVSTDDAIAQAVLKTIGILSIINEPTKLPLNQHVLKIALGCFSEQEEVTLRTTLEKLVQSKVLLYRRHNDEYRLWEGSDVDVVGLLRHKKAEYETHFDPVAFLASKLPAPPILAHRYNEECGMTRYFEGGFSSIEELRRLLAWDPTFGDVRQVDGRVYYLIAESKAEIEDAFRLMPELREHRQVLFAIPRAPLNVFEPLLELYCLEQLLADTDFVSQDPALQRELAELADDCLTTIQRKIVRLYEPRHQETAWFYRGEKQQQVTSQAKLRLLVSDICHEVFPTTPRFYNELINRRHPSTTIVNARKKLIRAILENNGSENLGLTGYGPEVSIFRALLKNTGCYQLLPSGRYGFVGSEQIVDEQLRNTISTMEEFLHSSTDSPRNLTILINQLLSPPFGLRAGVLPVLFAAVFQAFPRPLTVIEEGVYVKERKAETFERMLFTSAKITVQCVKLPDEVSSYLAALPILFDGKDETDRHTSSERNLLQSALEAIYKWVHQLPACAMTTERLSPSTLALRTTLVKASDPIALVLREIPCVYLDAAKAPEWKVLSAKDRKSVLEGLRQSIHELESHKIHLAEEVRGLLQRIFLGESEESRENLVDMLRQWVGTLTSNIVQYLEDPQCAGFLTRVMSNYEDDRTLVESLASLVTGRSLSYWDDSFLRQFELGALLIYKKITETDALLKSRQEQPRRQSDPSAWTVRIEQGGQTTGELVLAVAEIPQKVLHAKERIREVLKAKTHRLTAEDKQRILVELLREEL